MATKINTGTGNFTTAGMWGVVDATSLLDSETNNTALTTSYVESAAFTPGGITVDGVAIKLASRAAGSPSNTITVRIALAGVDVAGTPTTMNVSDIDVCSTSDNEGGWYFFTFNVAGTPTPVVLAPATVYTLSVKLSATSTAVNLYRNSTAGNWSRFLRTTTTGAPAAGDVLHVMGDNLAAGTLNSYTVTMDNTATTDFGAGSNNVVCLSINKGGTVTFGTAASTNYYLKLSGDLIVYSSGALNIGTVATQVPRNSTAVLEFDPTADGGMGLICRNGSAVVVQGLSRTSGKDIVTCKLNTDEAINSTSLGVDTDTGWLDNDLIAVASTTRTVGNCEQGALNGNAGASTLTVDGFAGAGGGLAAAHSGTSPTQAEVVLLTRNVQIRSATSTLTTYCVFKATASIDFDWVWFRYFGANAADKRGLAIQTTTGSSAFNYCSLHSFDFGGVSVEGGATNNFIISDCTGYDFNLSNSAIGNSMIVIPSTSGTNWTVSNNVMMKSSTSGSANGNGFTFNDVGGTITGNTSISSNQIGLNFGDAGTVGTINNNTTHSGNTVGVNFSGVPSGLIQNLTAWRFPSTGMTVSASVTLLDIDGLILFGNSGTNLGFSTATFFQRIRVKNANISGDSTFSSSNGIVVVSSTVFVAFDAIFIDSIFSDTSGIKTVHTVADINTNVAAGGSVNGARVNFYLYNTTLGATAPVTQSSPLIYTDAYKAFIVSTKHNQTTGNHHSWFGAGQILTNTSTFNTASPSEEMQPSSASIKLQSGSKKVAVANGNTVTINAYVRKDGTYAGAAPRLVLKANPAVGIATDTVIDTLSVGANTWEQLTGVTAAATDDGVFEFIVDCDGTVGSVFTDDWTTS